MSCSHPTLVLFYANWCSFCSEFKPTWLEIKKSLQDNPNKVHLKDYEVGANKKLFKDENIKGYPTIRLYCEKQLIDEYQGPRTKEAILKFVKKHQK